MPTDLNLKKLNKIVKNNSTNMKTFSEISLTL